MAILILKKLECNKIMKDSLSSQNSFIFDRNWEKVNPKNDPTVSVEQAKIFLKFVVEDHERLNNSEEVREGEVRVMDKIELFLFKYIQEKQLAVSAKRQLPTLQKTPYRLTLTDCLEIWRWLSQDSTSYRTREVAFDDSMSVNEFTLGSSVEGGVEIKKSVDYSSKNKKSFGELSLQEQEMVLKKSLEMVHLYFHQFKIIFNHYCRFPIENQHKRINTFDDVSHSLQTLTINRFMLFCREFDILKTLEFKRRTEHNPSMSKEFLMKTFKKNSHHQKFMSLESFLMTLVHISIKIHENFDPRSYMHTQIFLSSLKVKYYEQFVAKLDSLHIKYSPTDFYNCYRHIFNKQSIKKKKEGKKQTFQNNSYLTKQDYAHRGLNELGNIRLNQSVTFLQKQPVESRIYRSHHSVPNLLMGDYGEDNTKNLQRKKVSVPALPSLEENRFFKPLEYNHHLNSYSKYLQKVEETSSVFKNRITGYSNINALKHKGFHTNPNPQAVSKETLGSLLAKKKMDSQASSYNNRLQSELPQENPSFGVGQPDNEYNYRSQNTAVARRAENKQISTEQSASQQMTSSKLSALTSKGLLRMQQKKQALQSLRQKIDVREDDQLLKKHLATEENRQKETATESHLVQN